MKERLSLEVPFEVISMAAESAWKRTCPACTRPWKVQSSTLKQEEEEEMAGFLNMGRT